MAEAISEEKAIVEQSASFTDKKKEKTTNRQRKGILSRIWHAIFSRGRNDFEKKLQYLSKEEASVHSRMKKRAQTWRSMARNLIVYSVVLEAAALFYAIMTTRSVDLNWKMRALRVMPVFAVPFLGAAIYSTLSSYKRMRDRSDQKTLERLRAERQAEIDELKERTNYYITQQLIQVTMRGISLAWVCSFYDRFYYCSQTSNHANYLKMQRYDTDPAAKAAAATVLASKLGADSGLKVMVGDEPKLDLPHGKSSDIEVVQSTGLRNRKAPHLRSNSGGSVVSQDAHEETPRMSDIGGQQFSPQSQAIAVTHHQRSTASDGGWIARLAAMLVGEDPTQCYALICGNCHMHNGLARKEDFPYITYYCPHCHALNGSGKQDSPTADSSSKGISSPHSDDGQSSASAGTLLEGKVIDNSLDSLEAAGMSKVEQSDVPAS
ncbi:uncharacterized protein At2g24330-like isoform X1 [Nymphaea colorata]|nr:uncharacterized protein At2g24330-like isoform X1 [Nymphaea colorata]